MAPTMNDLRVKLFADGANKNSILHYCSNPLIVGFTTNPTLMRKAGITNYEAFAKDILASVTDKPISFEVFSDDLEDMYVQARKIGMWGENVYVKIPVTNTSSVSTVPLIRRLSDEGVKLNVTALFTVAQVETVSKALASGAPSCISIFAGRIADSGRDPVPIMREALALMASHRQQELIWASPREVFNVAQADSIGCHIITATSDILAKLPSLGKDLDQFSLETVRMFHDDAAAAGFSL